MALAQTRLLLALLLQPPGCLTSSRQRGDCEDVRSFGAKCDSATDDTAALQAAIDACAPRRRRVVVGGGLCLSQPLTLRTHTELLVAKGATLKAGRKWVDGRPFVYASNATDIAIVGNGTIDGSGAQWWLPHGQPGRPHLIRFDSVSDVLLQNLTLLNPANHFTNLHGDHYRIYGVTMRSPPSHIAPNTDGVNTKCTDVHVRGCDISNGDDSVVMKAPSRDVLVEDTVVRQGNGFVVGTADDTFEHVFSNITFRRSVAENTTVSVAACFASSLKLKRKWLHSSPATSSSRTARAASSTASGSKTSKSGTQLTTRSESTPTASLAPGRAWGWVWAQTSAS